MSEEQSTPEEGTTETPTEGTTTKLFPDMVSQPPSEPAQPETPPQEVQKEAPTPEPEKKQGEPGKPIILTVDEYGDAIVRGKVDGQEIELPFREVVKRVQTNEHLTRKGQKLGEQERQIQERLKGTAQIPTQPFTQPISEDDPLETVIRPHLEKRLEPLRQELAEAKEVISSLKTVAAPLQYQQNLKALDMDLKARGLTDFNEYVPKIETELSGMTEEERQTYDTRQGFETLYLRLKVQEKPKPTRESRPVPNVPPQVQTGSAPSNIDDSKMTDKKLFERAAETGNLRDWAKLFEFRDKPPGG